MQVSLFIFIYWFDSLICVAIVLYEWDLMNASNDSILNGAAYAK